MKTMNTSSKAAAGSKSIAPADDAKADNKMLEAMTTAQAVHQRYMASTANTATDSQKRSQAEVARNIQSAIDAMDDDNDSTDSGADAETEPAALVPMKGQVAKESASKVGKGPGGGMFPRRG